MVRALLAVRALPSALLRGAPAVRALRREASAAVTLRSLEAHGFRVLATHPPAEIVLGLEGRFWRPSGELCTPPPEAFRTSRPAAGTARATWNFRVVAVEPGVVDLVTETRVQCADATTRRRFLPYWALIRPWSGLIRRRMLHAIRRVAEDLPR
jgi:hypothetical protein